MKLILVSEIILSRIWILSDQQLHDLPHNKNREVSNQPLERLSNKLKNLQIVTYAMAYPKSQTRGPGPILWVRLKTWDWRP